MYLLEENKNVYGSEGSQAGPNRSRNSDKNGIVLNVKQRRQEQLLSGLIVEICIGKAALRRGNGKVGMAAK